MTQPTTRDEFIKRWNEHLSSFERLRFTLPADRHHDLTHHLEALGRLIVEAADAREVQE